MKTLNIRKARKGLSHPEQMFADTNEVLIVCWGKSVTRILPAKPKIWVRSLTAFRTSQSMQTIPCEILIREDRDARD